jgi:hypothetical protein
VAENRRHRCVQSRGIAVLFVTFVVLLLLVNIQATELVAFTSFRWPQATVSDRVTFTKKDANSESHRLDYALLLKLAELCGFALGCVGHDTK